MISEWKEKSFCCEKCIMCWNAVKGLGFSCIRMLSIQLLSSKPSSPNLQETFYSPTPYSLTSKPERQTCAAGLLFGGLKVALYRAYIPGLDAQSQNAQRMGREIGCSKLSRYEPHAL